MEGRARDLSRCPERMPYRHDVFLCYRRDPLLALQKAAEKLKETAANMQQLGNVPDAIEAVKTALDQLKAKTPQV